MKKDREADRHKRIWKVIQRHKKLYKDQRQAPEMVKDMKQAYRKALVKQYEKENQTYLGED